MIIKLLTLAIGFALARCGSPQEVATQPAAPAASQPEVQAPSSAANQPVEVARAQPALHVNPEIDALLTKLEGNAADLEAFTAVIAYEKIEAILERKELRTGEMIYRSASPAAGQDKAFAVLFESTVVNGVKRASKKHYIFNGRWLVEVDHQAKQFIKREIVPPGETLDPLKLGEGPFPLPIGQAKAEVLKRFEVSATSVPTEGLLKELKGVDGLRLTPLAGTPEAEDYVNVDLFYDRQTLLPVGIIAREVNEDVKTVRLKNLKRNPKLDQGDLKKLDITEPDPRSWRVDIQPWT